MTPSLERISAILDELLSPGAEAIGHELRDLGRSRADLDACCLECFAGGRTILEQKMCDAFSIDDESSSTFNAHTRASQGMTHLC